MTAVVNGRIFRGVLFSQMNQTVPLVPSSMIPNTIPMAVPIPYTNSYETSYLSSRDGGANRRQHLQHTKMRCPRSSVTSEGSGLYGNINGKLKCDLEEGVVLTLGGPGSSVKDC